jgi:hypothetical protein
MRENHYRVDLEVYQKLERALPDERSDIVLQLIQKHPEGRLEVPARAGVRANLQGIDLSRATLDTQLVQFETDSPVWRRRDRGCALLEAADIRGAILIRANLEGACLWGAKFTNAELVEANLRRADLWLPTSGSCHGGRQASRSCAEAR